MLARSNFSVRPKCPSTYRTRFPGTMDAWRSTPFLNLRTAVTGPSASRVKRDMREMRMMNRQFVAGLMVGLLVAGIPAGLLWIRISKPPAPQDMGFYIPGEEGVTSPVLIREQKPLYTAEALQAIVSGS